MTISVSTHVLDVERGRPATGVPVELYLGDERVGGGATDADGRIPDLAADPVAGLVFSGLHRVDRLYVGGEPVVRDGRLVRADEDEITREHRAHARRFAP